jgi:membrane dipeptidase
MFNLTPEQEERAQRNLREAVTIDSLGGYDEPTEEYKRYADELLAKNLDYFTIYKKLVKYDFEHPMEFGEPWKEGLRTGGLNALSLTMGPWGEEEMFSFDAAVKDLALWQYKFDVVGDLIKVLKAADIERAKKEGKFGIILNFQNTTHIGASIDNIDFFYQLGVRQIQMTYNDLNRVGAGCTERVDCGLSNFGLEVVERMNKLGILIDVSHSGYQTSLDTIEASEVPVAFTHTVCKAVHEHDRGKTDDQLEAIASKNGYVGIVVVPNFITAEKEATLEHTLDHIDHAVRVVGADKVGIGTDFAEPYPPLGEKMNQEVIEALGFEAKHNIDFNRSTKGYRNWRDFINFSRGLVSRGYKDEEIQGILGGNFLRIFREVVG